MTRIPIEAEIVVCDDCGREEEPEQRPWDRIPGYATDGTTDLCDVCRGKPHECVDTEDDMYRCWRCGRDVEVSAFYVPPPPPVDDPELRARIAATRARLEAHRAAGGTLPAWAGAALDHWGPA